MKKARIKELNEIVQKSYDLTAQHFSATRDKMAGADFLWAAERINNDDKVLDAGCGNGRLLDYVNLKPENYLGIDSNKELIKIAQEKYPDYYFTRQSLQNVFEIKEKQFSVIFCSAAIIHIPGRDERIALLNNFKKISSPEARLIISAWKMTGSYYNRLKIRSILKSLIRFNLSSWRDLVFPWLDQDGNKVGQRYYHLFSIKSLKKELWLAGWQVKEVLNDRHNFWFVLEKKIS